MSMPACSQSGRLLTTDQWGDYIIYSFYPRQKVFVDGRSDFYGERLGRDYIRLLQGAYDWHSILERYRFRVALLPVDLPLGEPTETRSEVARGGRPAQGPSC